jgi:hypothetical protein
VALLKEGAGLACRKGTGANSGPFLRRWAIRGRSPSQGWGLRGEPKGLAVGGRGDTSRGEEEDFKDGGDLEGGTWIEGL